MCYSNPTPGGKTMFEKLTMWHIKRARQADKARKAEAKRMREMAIELTKKPKR